MPHPDLLKICGKNISAVTAERHPQRAYSPKGRELGAELGHLSSRSEVVTISNYFSEGFFKTKKLVYTTA